MDIWKKIGEERKARFAVGIDFGSMFTRCVVAEAHVAGLRYVGHGAVRSTASRKGEIISYKAAAYDARRCLEVIGIKEKDAAISVGWGYWGNAIVRCSASMVVEDGRKIWSSDKEALLRKAARVAGQVRGMELDWTEALQWTVDGAAVDDPWRADGRLLEVDAVSTLVRSAKRSEMTEGLKRNLPSVHSWNFEIVAAWRTLRPAAAFLDRTLVVDIGAESSAFALCEGETLTEMHGVMNGATQIIRNTSFGLGIPFEDGLSLFHRGISGSSEKREGSLSRLSATLFAKETEEFVAALIGDLSVAQMGGNKFPSTVVLIGGSRSVGRFSEAFEEYFPGEVCLGYPTGIEGFPNINGITEWCTAYGLALDAGDEVDITEGDIEGSGRGRTYSPRLAQRN